MDQDVMHRVVQPSVLAKRPRYSLVWKLAFLAKHPHQVSPPPSPPQDAPNSSPLVLIIRQADFVAALNSILLIPPSHTPTHVLAHLPPSQATAVSSVATPVIRGLK
jgi:hypothetical protein